MSSSFIVEPRDDAPKKDETLIIMVSDDGTISVDEDTLQNLIMSQTHADVSVVKLGPTEGDEENGGITLTVDPPRCATTVSSENTTNTSTTTTTTTSTTTTAEGTAIVDPFMEMDPEQLERLETALQSEEAKQILGENVTAMLDMLTVEERQNSLKHSIELDHCYTSRLSPSEPKPTDPLPIAHSPDIEVQHVAQTSVTPAASPSPSVTNLKAAKIAVGRPRRSVTATSFIGTPKTAGNSTPRSALHPMLQDKGAHKQNDDEAEEDDSSFSLSESSESDSPSDNDSDFGPRGPRRSGVRARGGRKGLTTRGGSMAARRRGSNKRMDSDQARRLDLEMAAAVDAMKSPEKEEKTDKANLKVKKPRSIGGKKKEEPPPLSVVTPEASPVEKPLLTTNQVKANLINANMIKGDMILTKPGETRSNQKVIFVQKKIVMKANEMKIGLKKSPIIIPKGQLISQSPSSPKITTKDGKLVTIPMLPKSIVHSTPGSQPRLVSLGQIHVQEANQVIQQPQNPPQQTQQHLQQTPKHIPQHTPKHTAQHTPQHTAQHTPQHIPQHTPKQHTSHHTLQHTAHNTPKNTPKHTAQHTPQTPQQPITPSQSKVQTIITPIKPKLLEVKKEKKKIETIPEPPPKIEEVAKIPEAAKVPEVKGTPDASKKHVKKEQKKSPAILAEALGPALFSTPDIIRRVSVGSESKNAENLTTTAPVPSTITAPATTQVPIVQSTPVKSAETPSKTLQVSPKNAQIPKTVEPVQTPPSSANLEPVTPVANDSVLNVETKLDLNTISQPLPVEEPMEVDSENSQIDPVIPKDQKVEVKAPLAEELQSSVDPVVPEEVSERTEQPNVPNDIVPKQSGIEGEEHLLATLEMEASKHEDELLAEALLLQEELGVDLASGLDSSAVSEPLLSPSTFESPVLPPKEPEVKTPEAPSEEMTKLNENSDQSKKKEEKEPIQIIRGGRVITLPPIEAPATRSKKLQARNDSPQNKKEAVAKLEKPSKPTLQELIQREEMESEADDDEFEDEGDNSDSEDDPDRLWCICKRPHNNRFMICCDVCEDWFHGKCVHVSKAMGQQMEEQGIEWVCPNCTKKKAEEAKGKHASPLTSKRKSTEALFQTLDGKSSVASPSRNVNIIDGASVMEKSAAQGSGITQCVVCKKEARNSSIYCSDNCILAHAQETWPKDKPVPVPSPKTPKEVSKGKQEGRVMVFERKTGKVFTGAEAPTAANLKTWLKEHPTFEVVRPNNLNTFKIGGKTVTAIQNLELGKQVKLSPQEKPQLHPKMVFAKVPGSKQTVLAASTKKTIIVPTARNSPPPLKIRVAPSPKTPVLKQTTIKTAPPPKVQTPTIKPVKKQESKTPTIKQQPQRSPLPRKSETEPIRVNVRKTIGDSLMTRIKATSDLKLTQEEITDLALTIELELYKYFKDTGSKYKAKYRSLVFNIKDTKNLTLFRKIADRSLTPDAVVRLSAEEMASQELAEWREKETKHQLEMIKKNELDLMAQAKSIVVKTHKGEQVIENDRSDPVDPKTAVQDIVTALNRGNNVDSKTIDEKKEDPKEEAKKLKLVKKKEKEKEKLRDSEKPKKRERSKSRHRHSKDDRDHSKTREKSKDRKSSRNKDSKKEKDREKEKEKDKEKDKDRGRDREKDKKHKRSKSKNRKSHKDYKEKEKKDDEKKKDLDKKKDPTPPPLEKSIEDRLWRHIDDETTTNTFDGNDSDLSDREPSSTVTIKTPDINDDLEIEKDLDSEKDVPRGPLQTVWRGFVSMPDVAKFFITAQEVSGQARDLMEDLPDTVDVVGRIGHETVWDYISKMKKNGTKEILVIRLTAANDEEKIPYITLYSYLNSRSRLGVVGNVSKNIKDFYIMPFSNLSQVPNVLLPLDGPGFEEQRPPLLLGIIVRNKRKRPAPVSLPVVPAKVVKKDSDRSYTPPPILPANEKSTTPPSSPRSHHKGIAESLPEKVVTQQTLESLNKAQIGMSRTVIDSATISKIVPELSSKIDLTSTLSKTQEEDDDEPYSPGEMDEDGDDSSKSQDNSVLEESKNANSELQRKMDELNRQIEEQKQQIQSISSSFLGDGANTLPGLGLDPEAAEGDDAYSPSDTRSFTPPPQGLSKFSQPILDKVSDITIPANLQEILANVKRQETTKVDPYLPSKPGASFLTSVNTRGQKSERFSPFGKGATSTRFNEKNSEGEQPVKMKETKTSTLSSMSELDLIKKAAEQLATEPLPPPPLAMPPGLFSVILPPPTPAVPPPLPPPPPATSADPPSPSSSSDSVDNSINYPSKINDSFKTSLASNQPRPPGLEDDDELPSFVSQPTSPDSPSKTALPSKFLPKSGVVLSVKRKLSESESPSKSPRTKSRWGQPPSD